MKCLKVLVSVFVVMLVGTAVCFTVFAGQIDQSLGYVVSANGSQNTVTAAASAGTVGTAVVADKRVGGFIQNTTTFTIRMSLTASTTTGIDAAYFIIYPAPDTYGRDKFNFIDHNTVYQGPAYFYGYDPTVGAGVAGKTATTVQIIELK
jgi:hypothetical protein